MEYLFHTPIPVPWLLADVLTLLVSFLVMSFVIHKSKHPVSLFLEGFAFVFLYASIFENFAVVQGWYVYGRSFLMVGDVPLSVPLLEMDVFMVGLWLLQKMDVPDWCKPFIMGLFGMLQDFSLDPVAVRQVFTVQGVTSGRWTWILQPGVVNIYSIPAYNFPGWMLIMMYGTVFVLIGRWWFKRSGYRPAVGYAYPLIAGTCAMLAMASPLSSFLLWLGPFGAKGTGAEWVMLAFHLIFPTVLLAVFWRGKMKRPLTVKGDLPVFVVFILFHLFDITVALASGFSDVLGLVLLASAVHIALLGLIYYVGRKAQPALKEAEFFIGP